MKHPASGSLGPGPVISIDIGGTSIRGGIVGLDGPDMVTHHHRIATLAQDGGTAVLQRVLTLVGELHALTPGAARVAVASAGVIEPDTGRIASATALMPAWAGTELGRSIQESTGLRCTVINDVHAHGLGEFTFGVGVGGLSALIIAVGTGLGGAFITAGELVRGSSGFAGHIGHMHHGSARGMECSCGRSGHLESVASGSGMAERYEASRGPADPSVHDGAGVAQLAATGVEVAQKVLRTSGFALGESLGSLANMWDPEKIILTGSVTGAGDDWWGSLEAAYRFSVMDELPRPRLLRGALGDDAPLLGAAVTKSAV